MSTMGHLWKCVLLWCGGLLIFLDIVASLPTCLRSGECPSGFYCHTGSGSCMSCSTCSNARGNLHLCEKECFPVVHTSPNPDVFIEGDSSASNERMIVAIVALTVTTVFLVPVIVGVICWRRQRKTRILGRGVEETGDIAPSRMDPTSPLPLPECASPDESPLLVAGNHQC